tara:strand:- start:911 stop:2062 length:1152 start_codon:yes stop_codon:yes gene_type:complete
MVDRSDINAVDDAAWEQAVAREAVIRRLASMASPDRSEFLVACRQLQLKRSRLYDLIKAYKARPITSSLLTGSAGTQTGSRRLPEVIEVVISEAIEDFFKSRQKPSINALHKEVCRRCAQQGLRAPCWTSIRDRVAAIDPAELVAAREGPKAARSDIKDRGDDNSVANSAMTLDELEQWFPLEITRYHAERHRSLAVPPISAWQEAVQRRDTPLRHPYDPEGFRIDFLPTVERMVRRDGIHLFGLRYWDDVLSIWAGRQRRQLRVSYDPRDLSIVFVRDPDGQRYPVRFADLRHPPITLAEHRRAQTVLRERGRSLEDENLIFAVIEEQRALVATASSKTREARRFAERRDRALAGVETAAIEENDPKYAESGDILDVPTFEV